MEKAIAKKAAAVELTPLLQAFRATVEDFVTRLRAALPCAEPPPTSTASNATPDLDRARLVVQEMAAHLSNFDPTASECLEANRDLFRWLFTDDTFAAFAQQVDGFAFAEAQAALQKAAAERGLLPS